MFEMEAEETLQKTKLAIPSDTWEGLRFGIDNRNQAFVEGRKGVELRCQFCGLHNRNLWLCLCHTKPIVYCSDCSQNMNAFHTEIYPADILCNDDVIKKGAIHRKLIW